MTTLELTKGMQLKTGNFIVSIGTFDISEVAIFSKSSGDFVKQSSTKRSKKLKKVKRKFNSWLNSSNVFSFSHMTEKQVEELINLLK